MAIKITIEFENVREAAVFLTRASEEGATLTSPATEVPTQAPGPVATPDEQPAEVIPAQKPKRQYPNGKPTGRPPRALPPVEAPQEPAAPASTNEAVSASTPVDTPAAAVFTQADAMAALESVFEAKGFEKAQSVVASFGAAKLRDLPAEKYEAFVAACKIAKGE